MQGLIRDSYWSDQIDKWKTTKLTCVRCGNFFNEASNIGSWLCWQHPYYPAPGQGGTWPCCGILDIGGKTGRRCGCVKADHTTLEIPFDESHNVPIPKVLVATILNRKFDKKVTVDPDSISNTEHYASMEERLEADSYVTIRRYDLSETDTKSH